MVEQRILRSDNTVFIILSFEGPDSYSMAGGLGTRVTNLSRTLAGAGFPTHLFFIGDPTRKGEEYIDRKLTLHRWCQWISEYYPNGVYHGENDKVNDFNDSIPAFVVDGIIKPALTKGKLVVVLGEEWHTAEAICRIGEQLKSQGIRDNMIALWNANNTFGFDRIDWARLARNTVITTVSRYMKYIMREIGVNSLVIPNGIPEMLLDRVDDETTSTLRDHLESEVLLTKVARFDSTKGWDEAIEATARLKSSGTKTRLIARGGVEPYGGEILYNARHLGLKVKDVTSTGNSINDYLEAIGDNDDADVLNIRFQCPQELLRILYRASDAVLANSSHEPFGLVGLETMAAGGVAFTGGTGEDYASHMHNAVVLDTRDPREIEGYINYLDEHKEKEEHIRNSARQTAREFTWQEVLNNLIGRIETQAIIQGIMPDPARSYLLESELTMAAAAV